MPHSETTPPRGFKLYEGGPHDGPLWSDGRGGVYERVTSHSPAVESTMPDNPTTPDHAIIIIKYEFRDGAHSFTSPTLPGLHVSHRDLRLAATDVGVQMGQLLKEETGDAR